MKEQSEDNLTPLEAALERRRGAPTKKTPEILAEILTLISEGKSARKACKQAGISSFTWLKWLKEDEDLSLQYARASELGADALADECLEIADNPKIDPAKGRLQTDIRKWNAAKNAPKKYGDKQQVEVTGNLVTNDLSKVPQNVLLAAAEVAGLEAKSEDVGGVQDEPEHAAD